MLGSCTDGFCRPSRSVSSFIITRRPVGISAPVNVFQSWMSSLFIFFAGDSNSAACSCAASWSDRVCRSFGKIRSDKFPPACQRALRFLSGSRTSASGGRSKVCLSHLFHRKRAAWLSSPSLWAERALVQTRASLEVSQPGQELSPEPSLPEPQETPLTKPQLPAELRRAEQ